MSIIIPSAPFFFAFNGCDGFVFQPEDDVLPVGREDAITYRYLHIHFPGGQILKFQDVTNTFPDPDDFTSDAGSFGNLSSNILQDMTEWGLIDGHPWINVDLAQLKIDVGLYPEMFVDSDREPTEFAFDMFPSGVYKIYYSILYEETVGGGGNDDELDSLLDGSSSPYSKQTLKRIISVCSLDACLMGKIDTYFETRCTDDSPCHKYQEDRDMLKDIILLKATATIDFAAERFDDANKKIIGAANLCATGVCTYKHGC